MFNIKSVLVEMKNVCLVSVVSVDWGPPLGRTLGRNDTAIKSGHLHHIGPPTHSSSACLGWRREDKERRQIEVAM